MSQLIIIEKLNPIEVFTNNGLDELIDRIEKEAKSFVIDMTTEKGRDELNKLSKKVNRSKTLLDEMGKSLTEDWKKKAGAVDAERRRMRDRLDQIKDEVRQPLTDYENAEKSRTDSLQSRLNQINSYMLTPWVPISQQEVRDHLEKIKAIELNDWQEFTQAATASKQKAIAFLTVELDKLVKHDSEQEELKRLREQDDAKKQKEREDQIATDAVQRERERILSDKKREDAETAKRESDRNHKAKVNNEVLAALIVLGISEDQAKEVVTAIAKGLIPNLEITY